MAGAENAFVNNSKASAPIALFVYNRPEHTVKTVRALARNIGAPDFVLHIFSDAARSNDDIDSVNAVRAYIRHIDGFQKVIIVERSSNFGLARSIIEGVTELCEKFGRVIVLEDDLETSPYFLSFMNDALIHYEASERVMHISGCCYPVDSFCANNTYFLQVPLCWGWGTWKRAWRKYEKRISIMSRFDAAMVKRFDFDDSYPYWKQLELNRSGRIDTWFVFWYACIFLRGGLCLFPARSLVRNIGFDNSGTHGGHTVDYDVALSSAPVIVEDIPITESVDGVEKHRQYFVKIRQSLVTRVIRKIRLLANRT